MRPETIPVQKRTGARRFVVVGEDQENGNESTDSVRTLCTGMMPLQKGGIGNMTPNPQGGGGKREFGD